MFIISIPEIKKTSKKFYLLPKKSTKKQLTKLLPSIEVEKMRWLTFLFCKKIRDTLIWLWKFNSQKKAIAIYLSLFSATDAQGSRLLQHT